MTILLIDLVLKIEIKKKSIIPVNNLMKIKWKKLPKHNS
jgi:hypothetical protein